MTQRAVPAGVRREVDRESSAEQLWVFLTISHEDLITPIRVVSNSIDCVLGGETFTGFRFDITIVSDTDQAPFAQLTIQNVDQRIGAVLRQVTNPAKLKIELIAGSEFNQAVEPHTEIGTASRTYTADELILVNVEVDALFISGRLQTYDYATETWPGLMATQEAFPGLFR